MSSFTWEKQIGIKYDSSLVQYMNQDTEILALIKKQTTNALDYKIKSSANMSQHCCFSNENFCEVLPLL